MAPSARWIIKIYLGVLFIYLFKKTTAQRSVTVNSVKYNIQTDGCRNWGNKCFLGAKIWTAAQSLTPESTFINGKLHHTEDYKCVTTVHHSYFVLYA